MTRRCQKTLEFRTPEPKNPRESHSNSAFPTEPSIPVLPTNGNNEPSESILGPNQPLHELMEVKSYGKAETGD